MKLSTEIKDKRVGYEHSCPGIVNFLEQLVTRVENLEKSLELYKMMYMVEKGLNNARGRENIWQGVHNKTDTKRPYNKSER